MVAVSLSASLDERDAQKIRALAARERRSVSGFISNAVLVFADLPKDLRDTLIELRGEESRHFEDAAREMLAAVARRKFDVAAQRLAAEGKFPALREDATEQDMLDEASALIRGP
ncbi:protein of unknown function [Bradyrhizobium sp. ORS 285]|uniref:hypothetical protein n=1 Tax=Bradyrhizobium sp. ORS 285 TaxID=115808 RepID=UPI0002408A83|nr:hypothetical protein [Bradyrhizobium sp. ORS 285]CCD89766.1 hypothetical protein BRAO285_80013 [Bradyrhizobium sp. ORS 285]SMX61812.1 protein of unknown function [Bradyrhizobium sp. ORS 285]